MNTGLDRWRCDSTGCQAAIPIRNPPRSRGKPTTEPTQIEHDRNADPTIRGALRHARLRAERDAVAAAIPPDPGHDLHRNRSDLVAQRQALADLKTGDRQWADTPVGTLARQITVAERARQEAVWRSNSRKASRSEIRGAKRDFKQSDTILNEIQPRYEQLAAPQRDRINRTLAELDDEQTALTARAHERRQWITEHPETPRRLRHLDTELDVTDRALGIERDLLDGIGRTPQPAICDTPPTSTYPAHNANPEADPTSVSAFERLLKAYAVRGARTILMKCRSVPSERR